MEEEEHKIKHRKPKKGAFEAAFGIFKEIKGDSVDYVNKIRDDSEKRRKRLGL